MPGPGRERESGGWNTGRTSRHAQGQDTPAEKKTGGTGSQKVQKQYLNKNTGAMYDDINLTTPPTIAWAEGNTHTRLYGR